MRSALRSFLPWLIAGFVLWAILIALVLALEPGEGGAEFVYPI